MKTTQNTLLEESSPISRSHGIDNITNQAKEDLFFSLGDILGNYDIDQGNYFIIKDILDKNKVVNKRKLGITVIRSKEQLIETVVVDINPEEYEQFKKWESTSLHLSSKVLEKMPLISKGKPTEEKEQKKQESLDYKVNPTNLDYLNLGNKAIIHGKILDFTIVEYSVNQKGDKTPSIGILSLKTKEKRLISVHVELYTLGQGIIKKLEDNEGKSIKINTIVGKYKVQNIDLGSVSDNDILLPHLYDIQEKEQKFHDKLLQLQVDIDHCNEDIDEGNGDIDELKAKLKELKKKDKEYTTIKVLYLTK